MLTYGNQFNGPKLLFLDGSAGTGQTFVCPAFLAVDCLLQDLTKRPNPFGGKVVLLGGDFRQVLPVILRRSRSPTAASCLNKALFLATGEIFSVIDGYISYFCGIQSYL
ncbi:hypothetical protein AVEN_238255-1 [Araneus ventricosus]|uniref:ATP-dependent DNA helicase n=1 Tax=Araneus ventricosus TaxID=182803 RepID=A0A4Y2QMS6_ARAVE|nr:hypothetical protein AVEN_257739-1 [Araneus ventricosus]GBN64654.1 hypothetical protein AVEN_238255-1 [Araneus ventricosus]